MPTTGCRKIWRVFPVAAGLALAVIGHTAPLNADPLSPSAAQDKFYNLACTRLIRTLAENSEEAHLAEMPGWIRICTSHPRRSECIETAALIRQYRKAPFLKCGQDIKNSSDIAASFLPSFDLVCANVTATWLSHTESERQVEAAGWTRTCNAHPDVSVCKSAAELIDENRKVRPLTCGSNGN